jgi:protein-S-isoprenylcysteine O-methyltransferase Ste14
MKSHPFLTVIRVMAFALTLWCWAWLFSHALSPILNATLIIGGILVTFPTVWLGRLVLDRNPTLARVEWVTTVVHALLMLSLGAAIIKAIQTAPGWRLWTIPIPPPVGLFLVQITGLFTLFTVINLALRALGAPFAIALSRRLATDWLYRWTRNPMVLGTLACLVTVGIWQQSALFVLWVLLLVTPAWIAFLKLYEERELEIRFGRPYLDYKAKTPFLFPTKPLDQ